MMTNGAEIAMEGWRGVPKGNLPKACAWDRVFATPLDEKGCIAAELRGDVWTDQDGIFHYEAVLHYNGMSITAGQGIAPTLLLACQRATLAADNLMQAAVFLAQPDAPLSMVENTPKPGETVLIEATCDRYGSLLVCGQAVPWPSRYYPAPKEAKP